MITIRNSKVFLIGFIATFSASAHAGSALKGMAEAQQQEYKEIKALGKNATPDKLNEIHNRVMGTAKKAYVQEKTQQQQGFKNSIKKFFSGTKEQIAALWGLDPKTGKPIQRKPGEAPPSAGIAKPGATQIQPTITKTGVPAPTTGAQEGTGTAQQIDYGSPKKKDSDIKVQDGIIQEQ